MRRPFPSRAAQPQTGRTTRVKAVLRSACGTSFARIGEQEMTKDAGNVGNDRFEPGSGHLGCRKQLFERFDRQMTFLRAVRRSLIKVHHSDASAILYSRGRPILLIPTNHAVTNQKVDCLATRPRVTGFIGDVGSVLDDLGSDPWSIPGLSLLYPSPMQDATCSRRAWVSNGLEMYASHPAVRTFSSSPFIA